MIAKYKIIYLSTSSLQPTLQSTPSKTKLQMSIPPSPSAFLWLEDSPHCCLFLFPSLFILLAIQFQINFKSTAIQQQFNSNSIHFILSIFEFICWFYYFYFNFYFSLIHMMLTYGRSKRSYQEYPKSCHWVQPRKRLWKCWPPISAKLWSWISMSDFLSFLFLFSSSSSFIYFACNSIRFNCNSIQFDLISQFYWMRYSTQTIYNIIHSFKPTR
jgi:hypothetical protein